MTDKVIKVKIDAGDSKAQIDSLDKSMTGLGAAADKTTAEINQLNQINTQTTKTAQAVSQAIGANSNALGSFGRQAGQAGIQIQQFVGQVQGGVSPLVALSQQATDLGFVLGFPLLGAVVGIAAAIGGPLISSFIDAGESSDDLKKKLDGLQKSLQDLDAESKKAFTQVELGKLSTEYEKQQDKVTKLRIESEKLTRELLEASGPAQDRLAVRLNAVGAELLKAQAEMKSYADQMKTTGQVISESLVDGQNDAVDKTSSLTQQLELQRVELTQGELAARLLAAAFSTQAETVDELDPKIKSLITDNYNLEQQQKAAAASTAALTSEINSQAESDKQQAARAIRDQQRIDQRIANMRLETETLSSETVLQQAVLDGKFSYEESQLAAQTASRIMAATTEYEQLQALAGDDYTRRLEAEAAFRAQIAAINEQYAMGQDELDIRRLMMAEDTAQRIRDANVSAFSSGVSIMESFLGRSNGIVKAARIAMGAYQAFSIYASSQAAAAAALAPPPIGLGPIAGAGVASAISLSGKLNAAAVMAAAASSAFAGSGGGGYSVAGGSLGASATLPTTPQSAPTVGAFEIVGLAGLQDQLDRLDNDEVLPVSFTKRLVASLESVQRLQGA